MMTTTALPIPAWSPPGSPRTAPTVGHQAGGGKLTTGKLCRFRTRDNIVVGTWNVRTLTADRKLEELFHEMDQYCWNTVGISKLSWKGFGETSTNMGHKLYFSDKEDKHQHEVSVCNVFVNKETVIGCRLIKIPQSTSQSFRSMAQQPHMRAVRWKLSMINYKQSWIKLQRRTSLLCKETGMQRLERMLKPTGETHVVHMATLRRMKET